MHVHVHVYWQGGYNIMYMYCIVSIPGSCEVKGHMRALVVGGEPGNEARYCTCTYIIVCFMRQRERERERERWGKGRQFSRLFYTMHARTST